jgi:acetoin utilization deacetylase AcuC-like enzyme
MNVFYTDRYYANIGEGHVFPIRKFQLVRDRLLLEGTIGHADIIEPLPAALADILLVHTEDYVTRLRAGSLTDREIRRLGLPWSKALVRRSFLATAGTVNAARSALREKVASNLAGGTHHAFPERGEGFCVLNDVAIAIKVLQRDGLIRRAAVVDCDVHQGNGTAAIFAGDDSVFTFSMHGAKNYPLFKPASSLDIELPDGTSDEYYLERLQTSLPIVMAHRPDIIFYLGGADPFEGDKLGRLAISIEGLKSRDEMVLATAKSLDIPIATVMSGGYAKDINDTIEIHCNTIRVVCKVFTENLQPGPALNGEQPWK